MQAEICCGKLLPKAFAENFCGKLLRNTKSMKSPHLVKLLRQQNCRAIKISAPIKTHAEKFCPLLL
jgi:hypothetical protein